MEGEEEGKGTYWPSPAENVRQWTGPRRDDERSHSNMGLGIYTSMAGQLRYLAIRKNHPTNAEQQVATSTANSGNFSTHALGFLDSSGFGH